MTGSWREATSYASYGLLPGFTPCQGVGLILTCLGTSLRAIHMSHALGEFQSSGDWTGCRVLPCWLRKETAR